MYHLDPSRSAEPDNGRSYRVHLLLVLAALSVPAAAVRGTVAVAKAALLDGRFALWHVAEAGRVFTAPGE
jgi:hypothetical protein